MAKDARTKAKARRLCEYDGFSDELIAARIKKSRRSITNWKIEDAEAGDPWVKGRFSQELREKEAAAAIKAVEAKGWDRGRVLAELGTIAGSRITDYATWGQRTIILKPSDSIPPHLIGAISEISRTKDGQIKFKLHDKRAALVDIGRELGMFKTEAEKMAEAGIFSYYREQAAKRRKP